jgi:hypothetical protein
MWRHHTTATVGVVAIMKLVFDVSHYGGGRPVMGRDA